MGDMAEVSPAALYFLPKYWEAAGCLMLAPQKWGRQSWIQVDIVDTCAI